MPALRASAARGHQQLRDLERRAADCSRQAAGAARDFEAECLALGVSPSGCQSGGGSGGGVDGELRALVARELRPLLRRAAEALRSEEVGLAVGYYAAFVRYAHGGCGRGGKGGEEEEQLLLPALAAVRAAPSADLEEEGAAPTPSAAASDSDAATAVETTTTEISWEIDVSSSGAEAESGCGEGGGAEAAPGGIAWDIEVEGDGDDRDGDASSSTDAASAAAATPDPEKPPPDILSKLVSDPTARASLGDDLAELSAFLGQRLAAAKLGGGIGGGNGGGGAGGMMATAADLPPDAPAELSSLSSLEALQLALSRLRAAEDALSGERASLLLLLRQGSAGSRGAERVASRLRARAGAEGKFRRAAAAAAARAAVVRAELAADARALRRAAAAARDAKRRAEEGVAAILGGNRKVRVVGGEVRAVIAAAERGS